MYIYKSKKQKRKKRMGTSATFEASFEEALDKIALASWNRPRTNEELRDFVRRHHDRLLDVNL